MERKPLFVKEFMAAGLVTFAPNQDVREAIKLLIEKRIAGCPVVDNRGNLVGMLSQKDCLKVAMDAAGSHCSQQTLEPKLASLPMYK